MTLLDEQRTTINEDIDRKLQATTTTLQRSINDNIAALTTHLEGMVNRPPNNGREYDHDAAQDFEVGDDNERQNRDTGAALAAQDACQRHRLHHNRHGMGGNNF